jgi:hypothetical protein
MSMLEAALAIAAFVIGLTGTWSPCGFSMVETIGMRGHDGGRATTLAACATFAPGAVAGGILTFGALAGVGGFLHGAGGELTYLVAAGLALAAAVLEARGARIMPQIRRQLPEHWRWVMPMPVAAALYGVLLGLGFTTFVLSFGVWALGGISFALGDPGLGLEIGIAFGVGRALPIAILAPLADRPLGIRCVALMAERPALYRRFRLGDALALALLSATLVGTGVASAARLVSAGSDPSASGEALAWEALDGTGVLRQKGTKTRLSGTDPAIGGPWAAVISGGERIEILDRGSLTPVGSVGAHGVDALAIAKRWLAYRVHRHGRDEMKTRRLHKSGVPLDQSGVDAAKWPSQLSGPALSGGMLVYAVSRPAGDRIVRRRLGTHKHGTVVRSNRSYLGSPALLGNHLIYVTSARDRESPQATYVPKLRQQLMVKRLGHRGDGRRIYSRGESGTMWTTALAHGRAYVTVLDGHPKIVSVGR